jgi:hypothetical protein
MSALQHTEVEQHDQSRQIAGLCQTRIGVSAPQLVIETSPWEFLGHADNISAILEAAYDL